MTISSPGQAGYGAGSGAPNVMLAWLKHLWGLGKRVEAFSRLTDLVKEVQVSCVHVLRAW